MDSNKPDLFFSVPLFKFIHKVRGSHISLPPIFTAPELQVAQISMPRSHQKKPQSNRALSARTTRSQKENVAPAVVVEGAVTTTATIIPANESENVDLDLPQDLMMDNEPANEEVCAWTSYDA